MVNVQGTRWREPPRRSSVEARWTIYYADETVFTSEDGSWGDAPHGGVLIIFERMSEPEKTAVHMGMDYYLWKAGEGIVSFGERFLHQHMLLGIDEGAIKFGLWVSNAVWQRVHRRAFPGTVVGQGQYGDERADLRTEKCSV